MERIDLELLICAKKRNVMVGVGINDVIDLHFVKLALLITWCYRDMRFIGLTSFAAR